MSDPTDYVGTYDTTDVAGGAHQSILHVTAGAFSGEIPGKQLHPEGVADLEQSYLEGLVPHETADTSDQVETPVHLTKRTVRRK